MKRREWAIALSAYFLTVAAFRSCSSAPTREAQKPPAPPQPVQQDPQPFAYRFLENVAPNFLVQTAGYATAAPSPDTPADPAPPLSGRQRLYERLFRQGQAAQFLMLGESNHGRIGVAQFCADEDFMTQAQQAGYTHFCTELPLFFQEVTDEFVAGRIPDNIYTTILKTMAKFTGATPQTLDDLAQATADEIRLAAKYGMTVHCVDFIGFGGFDPEHTEAYTAMMSKCALGLKDRLIANPDLIKPNNPALLSEAYRDAQMAALGAQDMARIDVEKLDKLFDGLDWTEEEGCPQDDAGKLRYRLVEGDPKVAAYIAARVGDEKALVVYGASHFSRLKGDLDDSLGRDKVAVVEIFEDYDDQFLEDILLDAQTNIALGEQPDFFFTIRHPAICLKTETWIDRQFETVTCYGNSNPPKHAPHKPFMGDEFRTVFVTYPDNTQMPLYTAYRNPLSEPSNAHLNDFILPAGALPPSLFEPR